MRVTGGMTRSCYAIDPISACTNNALKTPTPGIVVSCVTTGSPLAARLTSPSSATISAVRASCSRSRRSVCARSIGESGAAASQVRPPLPYRSLPGASRFFAVRCPWIRFLSRGIGLRAGLPDQFDEERVGDVHGVARLAQLCREALPRQRPIHPDGHWSGKRAEPREHGLERGRQLPDLGEDAAGLITGAGGDVALVQIESDECHDSLRTEMR